MLYEAIERKGSDENDRIILPPGRGNPAIIRLVVTAMVIVAGAENLRTALKFVWKSGRAGMGAWAEPFQRSFNSSIIVELRLRGLSET